MADELRPDEVAIIVRHTAYGRLIVDEISLMSMHNDLDEAEAECARKNAVATPNTTYFVKILLRRTPFRE